MSLDPTFIPFIVALFVLCFGIGFFLLSAFFPKMSPLLTPWEILIYSFALSQTFLIFGMLWMGTLGIHLNILTLAIFLGVGAGVFYLFFLLIAKLPSQTIKEIKNPPLFRFSKKQGLIFILIITATLLIKTIYFTNTVLPSSTDMGHHLYWSKSISETGTIPVYEEQNIIEENGRYQVTAPEPIADFIIGEHLTLAALQIFSQASYYSAFPVIFLSLINLLGLFTLATLSFFLVRGFKIPHFNPTIWNGENAFLLTLFIFGPLYSLSSPQAKFASGGVIGNIFGNFFIPLILLCFYRGVSERDSRFVGLGLLFTFTLAYIHHLSTFMLLFILVAIILFALVIRYRDIPAVLKEWFLLLAKPLPLAIIVGATLFFFLVAMPTYIETNAVTTAVGTPIKTTRTGLTFNQITESNGVERVIFALLGAVVAFILGRRSGGYETSFVVGWLVILLLMTLAPGLLYVDIPSNRIGAYLTFPLGILAAIFMLALFASWQSKKFPLPQVLILFVFMTLFITTLSGGSYDNSKTLVEPGKAEPLVATMHASEFLAAHTSTDDRIVKDHNFIVGDAWMKLSFMRGYSYPFSRAFFNRYETNPDREQCTLAMISTPNTKEGKRCFEETGVNYVVVNADEDGAQFSASKDFSKIYASRYIAIYQRIAN